MTRAQLRAAVFAWVTGVTGWNGSRVIWSHPDAPRPAVDYLSLQVLSSETQGQGYQETDLLGNLTSYQWETAAVQVQGFGTEGYDKLNALRLALRGVTHREALNAQGLVRRGPVPEIREVPEIAGTAFEARSALTLRVGVLSSATEDAGYVDTVEYTLRVYDEAGDLAAEETITAEEG